MSGFVFQHATKKQSRLRMALIGPSGSGKTYTALNVGTRLGGKVALIDTERGSASKYADLFDFNVLELESFAPATYVEAIQAAGESDFDVLVIDSLSHAWMGRDGALEQVDRIGKRIGSGNNFAAWREVTPMHNALVDAILTSPLHVIATMRTKTEYVIEENEKGKKAPRKIGLAPVQRDGLEYEFDVVADLDLDNNLIVSKTRCAPLSGAVIQRAGMELADTLKGWLGDGEPLAKPADHKRLDKLISDLAKADPSRDWPEVAEKWAHREFRHGREQMSESEMSKALAEFGAFLIKVQKPADAPQEEPSSEPEEQKSFAEMIPEGARA